MSDKDWKNMALKLAAILERQSGSEIEGDGKAVVMSDMTESEAEEERDAEAKGFTAFRRKVAKIIGG
jgi:hypothetical protein